VNLLVYELCVGWDGIERAVVSLTIVRSFSQLIVCLCVCVCVRVRAYVSVSVIDLIPTQVPENGKSDTLGRAGDDTPIDGFLKTFFLIRPVFPIKNSIKL
jgi:hypothetical protein